MDSLPHQLACRLREKGMLADFHASHALTGHNSVFVVKGPPVGAPGSDLPPVQVNARTVGFSYEGTIDDPDHGQHHKLRISNQLLLQRGERVHDRSLAYNDAPQGAQVLIAYKTANLVSCPQYAKELLLVIPDVPELRATFAAQHIIFSPTIIMHNPYGCLGALEVDLDAANAHEVLYKRCRAVGTQVSC